VRVERLEAPLAQERLVCSRTVTEGGFVPPKGGVDRGGRAIAAVLFEAARQRAR
jgi:hypothetical protein